MVGHGRLRRSGSPDCTQLAPRPLPRCRQAHGVPAVSRPRDRPPALRKRVSPPCDRCRCRERFRDVGGEAQTD
ncbi:hypothetical protein DZD52_12945 [Xanthomonas nasturtii]|uniref:Uncharacterized protein n=1 Tax=Xanthomonas nasturtii TaxID=1843581 RepID=A0A3E1KI53_9XANT|nr:hypothetical protein DZD52_12945 [Xanthomonas nasturtii]